MKTSMLPFTRILTLLLALWPLVQLHADRKPNILVILADDLGFGDVGVHGWKDILTPHIDAFARSGIRFSSGYLTNPFGPR